MATPPHIFPNLSQSITAVRMIPFDGQGYGRSMNWHYQAVRCANKTGENCEHFNQNVILFDIDNVRIVLAPIEDGCDGKIKFKVTCSLCDKMFLLTSEKLTKKFIKFYGL